MLTQKDVDQLTYKIIGYAIEVHKELGPGLMEKVYEACLQHLLILNGHHVRRQNIIPLTFKGISLDAELRFDLLVDDLIVVEVKSVEAFIPLNDAQLLTYINLLKKPKGLLLNFNCVNIFRFGQKTLVNEYYARLPKE